MKNIFLFGFSLLSFFNLGAVGSSSQEESMRHLKEVHGDYVYRKKKEAGQSSQLRATIEIFAAIEDRLNATYAQNLSNEQFFNHSFFVYSTALRSIVSSPASFCPALKTHLCSEIKILRTFLEELPQEEVACVSGNK